VAGKLLTRLHFPLQLEAIKVSRYHATTRGSHIQWRLMPATSIRERAVLIVDDILDEGITLAAVRDYCMAEDAESVHIAALVDKRIGREKPCRADFVGLETGDYYLFGYGMDYKDYLRNAAGIYACHES
jgi:hypoxanthine phosphoribosyltransferase